MRNPNNNPTGFNNMYDPQVQPWVQQPWDQTPRPLPFPNNQLPQHFNGFIPQGLWGQPIRQPNVAPWSNLFNYNGNHDKLEEAREFAKENVSNFDSNPDYEGLQKEIRYTKLKVLESQIRSAIFPHTLGNFTSVNPPQILSLNGYRIEGMGEKLKHFDKEAKVEIINNLGNYYNVVKVNIENLTNVRDMLKNIVEDFDNNISNQTNMLNSLSVEIETIKSNNGEAKDSVKEEAIKSLEELAASLRDLGLTDEEVEAKLQVIQKALK